jgi:Holliday junction DNA helicase RuvA
MVVTKEDLMFAYLEGVLKEKHPTTAVVDVGGVGYEVIISLSTSAALPGEGRKVKLLTHFHVREDIQQIYGFSSEDEKALFKLLLSVSGIGPKMAVTILSGLPPKELARAVQRQDLAALSSISGVGKKTAERILIELRDKAPLTAAEPGKAAGGPLSRNDEKLQDAMLALISLGYNKASAQGALKKALQSDPQLTVEELIRESLKKI